MEYNSFIASLVIFISFLYSYSTVVFVKASIVTTEKDETYSKLPLINSATSVVVEGPTNCIRSIHEQKVCPGVVTIWTNRGQFLKIPYLNSAIYMLVNLAHEWNRTIWVFLKPFSLRIWITLICSWIFTGVAVYFFEKHAGNENMWFTISPQKNTNIANPSNEKRRMGKRHKRRNRLLKV
ncbi:Extracellular solute-binding protein, family 3 [Artemisia annua]|uniref:Extracellular solute-binding protein, family 3 n=1 Tax=Artemisia annua TaxID=35608 RepID=A0A2U1MIS2_ARTAN|nr:Extracellular solute-binding protein, family 3 [Artemisia annua]